MIGAGIRHSPSSAADMLNVTQKDSCPLQYSQSFTDFYWQDNDRNSDNAHNYTYRSLEHKLWMVKTCY